MEGEHPDGSSGIQLCQHGRGTKGIFAHILVDSWMRRDSVGGHDSHMLVEGSCAQRCLDDKLIVFRQQHMERKCRFFAQSQVYPGQRSIIDISYFTLGYCSVLW